jgi:mycofactocin system creatininase family protein
MTALATHAWPDVAPSEHILVVPLGSCEQHGPHLPLDTDARVAVALAERLADHRPGLMVAPAVAYGSSGEHAGFGGTLSIGREALTHVVVELVRSADAFRGVVLVNGHGGNAEALADAVATVRREGRRALAWTAAPPGGDAHAGRTETSVLLALAPHTVRMERATVGATAPLADLWPLLRAQGVAAVSPNGVLGDPTGASATEGRRIVDALATDLVAAVGAWCARW